MCLHCELKKARMRPITGRTGMSCGARRKNRQPAARLDPVRTLRICTVLERTVLTGFRPSEQPTAVSLGGGPACVPGGRGSTAEVFARQVAIYLAHVGCGLTYTQAARLYGRDRSTAAHACKVVEDRRDDPRVDRILELLEGCARMGLAQIEPEMAAQRVRP
jgi:hypothetical protein